MTNLARNRSKSIALAVLLAAALAGGGWTLWATYGPPKRFAVVEPGRLYRCGEITPRQLERVTRSHGIRTVLSMLDPEHPESVAERAEAERLGLRWLNVPLKGDGSSTGADRDQIRSVLMDSQYAPLLVHCAAGANRTGLACGMFRIHADGWTVEKVLEEMRGFGFDDLPKHENLRAALRAEAQLATSRPTEP
jgi:protein tyrosine/serine phosphatase